jgi:predicted amino acid-binding ACT domain protein
MANMSMQSQPPIALQAGTPYAVDDAPTTDFGTPTTDFGTPVTNFGAPVSTNWGAPVSTSTSTSSSAPKNFKELDHVKKTMDMQQAVLNQKINIKDEKRSGYSDQGSEIAAQREAKFAEAARREEQLYLMWVNNHISDTGKQIEDLGQSLKNGAIVMGILAKIGKLPAPSYAKNPKVMAQEIDNWEIVIKYMRKLGMPVDNLPGMPDDEDSIGLDALKLHEGDRREILKLFGKLLIYEAHNP